ncbi:MAG: RNA polymerase sigma factor [Planctomycetota bacterium]
MKQNLIEIVEKAQSGDLSAVGKLYDDFAPLVRAVAFDHTGDLHSIGDIVQEVFLAVLKGLPRLKQVDRFQSWIVSITRRKAIDAVRRQASQQGRAITLEEEPAENPVDPEPKEVLFQLRQAIVALPEQERLVVELFHLESLQVVKVMEIMDMPRSTVYAILIRARARLRKHMENLKKSERSP